MKKNCTTFWGPEQVFFRPARASDVESPASFPTSIPIQLSVHNVKSVPFLRELGTVFPGMPTTDEVTVICTMQRSDVELAGIGAKVEEQKDTLLERVRFI